MCTKEKVGESGCNHKENVRLWQSKHLADRGRKKRAPSYFAFAALDFKLNRCVQFKNGVDLIEVSIL